MKWQVMDITNMSYTDGEFDIVIDKGALDAIASDNSAKTMENVQKMFSEIKRVLKKYYICISLAQNYILNKLLDEFESGWIFKIFKVLSKEQSAFIPFCFGLLKSEDIKPSKFEFYEEKNKKEISKKQLTQIINETQWLCAARSEFSTIHRGNKILLHLYSEEDETTPRFTIYLIDSNAKRAEQGKCAIFIVPQGSEHEWLFSSDAGL